MRQVKWGLCILFITMGFRGSHTLAASPARLTIEEFVTAYYNGFLDRQPDSGGLQYWSNQLRTRRNTGEGVAYGFFYSQEYQSKFANISNQDFVIKVYSAMLGRRPDPSGLNNWVNHLNNGKTRKWVIGRFAHSKEFIVRALGAGVIPFWGHSAS